MTAEDNLAERAHVEERCAHCPERPRPRRARRRDHARATAQERQREEHQLHRDRPRREADGRDEDLRGARAHGPHPVGTTPQVVAAEAERDEHRRREEQERAELAAARVVGVRRRLVVEDRRRRAGADRLAHDLVDRILALDDGRGRDELAGAADDSAGLGREVVLVLAERAQVFIGGLAAGRHAAGAYM